MNEIVTMDLSKFGLRELEEAGVYNDILYAALGEVKWYDIAKAILKEVNG